MPRLPYVQHLFVFSRYGSFYNDWGTLSCLDVSIFHQKYVRDKVQINGNFCGVTATIWLNAFASNRQFRHVHTGGNYCRFNWNSVNSGKLNGTAFNVCEVYESRVVIGRVSTCLLAVIAFLLLSIYCLFHISTDWRTGGVE